MPYHKTASSRLRDEYEAKLLTRLVGGDVIGPAGATADDLVAFDGATGKIIKDSAITTTSAASAVSLKHTQGTDTALGTVGTKNPPIDADKVVYRDSVASDALVTSTWTQVKAFLKTYFDTLYQVASDYLDQIAATSPQNGDILMGKSLDGSWNQVAGVFDDTTNHRLKHESGGLEADVSAYNGLVKITGGATSAVSDTLHTQNTDTGTSNATFDVGSLKFFGKSVQLADHATQVLTTVGATYPSHGFVQVCITSAITESAEFEMGSDGTVNIIRGTTNVVANVDTTAKFCIGTSAAQNPLTIKNHLEATVQVIIQFWHG